MVYAKLAGEWASIGVTRHNMRKALFWGALTGAALILFSLMLFVSLGIFNPPIMLNRQLLIGIPVSFLVIGPFQELLFRGRMQPRLQKALGGVWGLLLCSALFSLWDALPPLKGVSASSIIQTYFQLIPISFCVAVVFGYIFHRTGNIIAPCIAHSLAVVGMIISGHLAFVS
jgi:membrane protease YdiL (CAAX protease family)